MSFSIHCVPVAITIKPMTAYKKPQAMIPPNATDRFELAPLPVACAVAIATTPIKAKLEPK